MSTDRPSGRTIKEFLPLTLAEESLVERCRTGGHAGPREFPASEPSADEWVRSSLVRFLALGGDEGTPVHEAGVRLRGAWVKGDLDLSNCRVPHPIALTDCHVDGEVVIEDAFTSSVVLAGTSVRSLRGARLASNGGLQMGGGFRAANMVHLRGATIRGDLDCAGGSFNASGERCPGNTALCCDGVKVSGDVRIGDGFEAVGGVSLRAAVIEGRLDGRGGILRGPRSEDGDGLSLDAEHATVKSLVLLGDGFACHGAVRFSGAVIGGAFVASGGSFVNPHGDSLVAFRAEFKGDVFLSRSKPGAQAFVSTGAVWFSGAVIGGSLFLDHGHLTGILRPGDAGPDDCFVAEGLRIEDCLFLNEARIEGRFSLLDASIGRISDDLGSWPMGRTEIDGCTYKRFAVANDRVDRVKWLKRQVPGHLEAEFRPQPWDQAAKALLEGGFPSRAKQVAVAKQDVWRRSDNAWRTPRWIEPLRTLLVKLGLRPEDKEMPRGLALFQVAAVIHFVYGKLAGYGYKPERVLATAVVVWAVCGVAFSVGHSNGLMAPTNLSLGTRWSSCCRS